MARKKKGSTDSIDFAGVETRKKLSGDYAIKVEEVLREKGDAGIYYAWEFAVSRGDAQGAKLFYNTSTVPKALWNLRSVLEAFGEEVPDGVMELSAKILSDIDTEAGCTVERTTFDGKTRNEIVDIFPFEDLEDVGEPGGGDDGEGSESDDPPDEDEINDMDKDELEEVIDEHDLDLDLDDIKGVKKMRKAVIKAIGEAAEKNGEEDDTYTEDEVNEMKKKALQGLIDKHDLDDVDLDDIKSLKKQRAAVIEALEEEDLIGDND